VAPGRLAQTRGASRRTTYRTTSPSSTTPRRPTRTNQASIIRFIEGNWGLGRIAGSFDAISGSLTHMFNFGHQHGKNKILLLNPATGQPEK